MLVKTSHQPQFILSLSDGKKFSDTYVGIYAVNKPYNEQPRIGFIMNKNNGKCKFHEEWQVSLGDTKWRHIAVVVDQCNLQVIHSCFNSVCSSFCPQLENQIGMPTTNFHHTKHKKSVMVNRSSYLIMIIEFRREEFILRTKRTSNRPIISFLGIFTENSSYHSDFLARCDLQTAIAQTLKLIIISSSIITLIASIYVCLFDNRKTVHSS